MCHSPLKPIFRCYLTSNICRFRRSHNQAHHPSHRKRSRCRQSQIRFRPRKWRGWSSLTVRSGLWRWFWARYYRNRFRERCRTHLLLFRRFINFVLILCYHIKSVIVYFKKSFCMFLLISSFDCFLFMITERKQPLKLNNYLLN